VTPDCLPLQEPAAWKPHSADSFQSPANRIDLLSYPKILGCGPRQGQVRVAPLVREESDASAHNQDDMPAVRWRQQA
jgi:hypothetical protein